MNMSKVKHDALRLLESIVILDEVAGDNSKDLAQAAVIGAGITEEDYAKMCDFMENVISDEELEEYAKVRALNNIAHYSKELIKAMKEVAIN